jgi:hypothetical protein
MFKFTAPNTLHIDAYSKQSMTAIRTSDDTDTTRSKYTLDNLGVITKMSITAPRKLNEIELQKWKN